MNFIHGFVAVINSYDSGKVVGLLIIGIGLFAVIVGVMAIINHVFNH